MLIENITATFANAAFKNQIPTLATLVAYPHTRSCALVWAWT